MSSGQIVRYLVLPTVCSCRATDTEHELVGWNQAKRPVWECTECGERRTGPDPSTPDTSEVPR